MIKIKKYFNTIRKTIVLLWSSSKIYFLLMLILSIILGSVNPLNLYLWKKIIDEIAVILTTKNVSFEILMLYLFLYLAVSIVNNVISNLSRYFEEIYSEYTQIYIKKIILNKIKQLDLKHFDDSNLYDEISKSNQESKSRSLMILKTLMLFIRNFVNLLGVLFLLISFSPIIVILCILTAIPLFYLNYRIMNNVYDIYTDRFEGLRLCDFLEKLLIKNENIKELKIFNMFNFISKRILKTYESMLFEDKKIKKKIALKTFLLESSNSISDLIIKFLAIIISLNSGSTIGSITMYINSIDSFKNSIESLLYLLSSIMENSLYMDSLFRFISIPISDTGEKLLNVVNDIKFENVYFKYPNTDNYILENITFELKKNKTYALVGVNGSGKTTLIKLVLGLYEPTEGDIWINGINMKNYNKYSIYENMSVIFQDFIKYPFDVKTNIALKEQQDVMDDRVYEAVRESGVINFINKYPDGLHTKLGKEWAAATEISQGQWQSVAIARAIYRNSEVIILDEPTSSLDAIAEYEIFNKIKRMKKDRIVILVSHRLSNVKLADNILVFNKKSIVEQGNHAQLIEKKGMYERMYNLQKDMYIRK